MAFPIKEVAALAGRLLLAAIFLHEAYAKLTGLFGRRRLQRSIRRARAVAAARHCG